MTITPILRLIAFVLCGIAAFAAVATTAQAQTARTGAYPTKAVRWIIPFPPGGATDLLGRFLGQRLSVASNPEIARNASSAITGGELLLSQARAQLVVALNPRKVR